jgi:hypothetical protein
MKVSVASDGPSTWIVTTQRTWSAMWPMKMQNSAKPRKKSTRMSRFWRIRWRMRPP